LTRPLDQRTISAITSPNRVINLRVTCPRDWRGLFSEHEQARAPAAVRQPALLRHHRGGGAASGRPALLAASAKLPCALSPIDDAVHSAHIPIAFQLWCSW